MFSLGNLRRRSSGSLFCSTISTGGTVGLRRPIGGGGEYADGLVKHGQGTLLFGGGCGFHSYTDEMMFSPGTLILAGENRSSGWRSWGNQAVGKGPRRLGFSIDHAPHWGRRRKIAVRKDEFSRQIIAEISPER